MYSCEDCYLIPFIVVRLMGPLNTAMIAGLPDSTALQSIELDRRELLPILTGGDIDRERDSELRSTYHGVTNEPRGAHNIREIDF